MVKRLINRVARRWTAGNRGQAMILLAMSFVGLLTAMGLAVDGGSLFMARTRLGRAVDAAALAAALKLPDCCVGSRNWGTQGYDGTTSSTTDPPCSNTSPDTTYTNAWNYLIANEPCVAGSRDNGGNYLYIQSLTSPNPGQAQVTACEESQTIFMRIIGIYGTSLCATATAGFGAIDLMLALDDTGSMDATEMSALINGVRSFIYSMNMSSAPSDPTSAKIGLAPFRGEVQGTGAGLITQIVPLTGDRETLLKGLAGTLGLSTAGGHGGSGTSIGVGVKYAYQELFHTPYARATGSVDKVMIMFTDGENGFDVRGEFCQAGFPCGLGIANLSPTSTRTNATTPTKTPYPSFTPVNPSVTPNPTNTYTASPNPTIASTSTRTATPNTSWTKTPTRTGTPNPPSATPTFGLTPTIVSCTDACLDREARRWAQTAKSADVVIYTIGYGATQGCGGGFDVDSCLLKEVASGSDKYYWANTSAVIGEAFAAIGQRIGHRLLK